MHQTTQQTEVSAAGNAAPRAKNQKTLSFPERVFAQ